MRKTQVLKINHHLKNGVTIAEDTETVLLNAGKTARESKETTKRQRSK